MPSPANLLRAGYVWIIALCLLLTGTPGPAFELASLEAGFPTADRLEPADSQWPVSRVLADRL